MQKYLRVAAKTSGFERSGNADGFDTLFSRGVGLVDLKRMQLVTSTAGHCKKNLHPENMVVPLSAAFALYGGEILRR